MKKIILVVGLALVAAVIVAYRPSRKPVIALDNLGLAQFYRGHGAATKSTGKVDALSEPEMGWLTDGRPVPNPTKVATQGLQSILAGDEPMARRCADWLLANSQQVDDSISFPFHFDFVPYWPFELRAPWSSAITQGLALGLFTQLHLFTGREDDLNQARRVAAFYWRPIEKGGFTRFEDQGPFFEEYPTAIPTRVLNGSIIAMIALHDYGRVSGDREATNLFEEAAARLEELLPEYEVKTRDNPWVLSTYSLAPIRPRLLMRFTGDGRALIHTIRLVGTRDGHSQLLAEVKVGEAKDANPMNALYIWYDEKFMNWGPRTHMKIADKQLAGRVAGEQKGSFDHSPFVLGWMAEFEGTKDLAVEVEYVPQQGSPLLATIYDGNEYWALGSLTSSPQSLQKSKLPLPPAFPLAKTCAVDPGSRVDNRYLDDNQGLLSLLADLTNDSGLRSCAQRWKDSCRSVPGRWMNWASTALLQKPSATGIVQAQPGLRLLGQPCALRVGESLHLFYTAIAPDGRSRIYLSTSTDDGRTWTSQGQVFDDAALPMPGNQVSPTVLKLAATGKTHEPFVMIFGLSDKTGGREGRLRSAYSSDGLKWRLGEALQPGQAVDPLLLPNGHGGCELYYVTARQSHQAQIMRSTSIDGRRWTPPSVAFVQRLHPDCRDEIALSGYLQDNRTTLLLENTTDCNRHVLLYSRVEGGEFFPCSSNPVYVADDWNTRWDAVRYDWCIFPEAGGWDVCYAGVGQLKPSPDSPVNIGRAKLNAGMIDRLLSGPETWKQASNLMH